MPTYEYACELCGHELEVFQSINAERLVNCPSCSKDGLKRLIGRGGGIIFKGTGFYQTDYKKTSAEQPKTSSNDKSTAPSSGDTSSSKPAAAPASSNTSTSNAAS